MKKKIKVSLAAFFCVCVLFSGCQKEKEIPKPASTERVTLDTQTEETGLPDIHTSEPAVSVLLNADGPRSPEHSERMERCFSLARTVCRVLEERGIGYDFTTNASSADIQH